MLLCNADIKGAVREGFCKLAEPRAIWHCGRHGNNLVVFLSMSHQRFRKHACIAGRVSGWLRLSAGDHIKLADTVILVRRFFRGCVAFALLGHNMNEDRPFIRIAHISQNRQQVIEIVAVNRPDIIETQFLEERSAGCHATGIFFSAPRFFLKRFGKHLRDVFREMAEAAIGASGNQACEISTHRAHRRCDGHVIIVQDYNQAAVHGACIVHGLISHARTHSAVANHGDDVVLLALQITTDGHAKTCRD